MQKKKIEGNLRKAVGSHKTLVTLLTGHVACITICSLTELASCTLRVCTVASLGNALSYKGSY